MSLTDIRNKGWRKEFEIINSVLDIISQRVGQHFPPGELAQRHVNICLKIMTTTVEALVKYNPEAAHSCITNLRGALDQFEGYLNQTKKETEHGTATTTDPTPIG